MVRLGKKEKEFIKTLKEIGGKGRLYKDVAPKLYDLQRSIRYSYAAVSKIANRLAEKGLIENKYEGKRRERIVYIKDED